MNRLVLNVSIFLFFFISLTGFSQGRVEWSAGSIKGKKIDGIRYNVLGSANGKRVKFTQNGTTVNSNDALQNVKTEDFIATGRVVVTTNDGAKITGAKLDFRKGSGRVIITGPEVVMTKDGSRVVTDTMYYNTITKDASYNTGGIVYDDNSILKSKNAYLFNEKGYIIFSENVVMDDTVQGSHLETDSLTYYTETKFTIFHKRTFIKSTDGTILADNGQYNNATKDAQFFGNVEVENVDYLLKSDTLYDYATDSLTLAHHKVEFYNRKDSVTIWGDHLRFDKRTNKSKTWGRGLMTKPLAGDDMLYLAADTLFSEQNETDSTTETRLLAYPKVQIFSQEMTGRCDSLVYDYSDSVIYFYHDPIIWSEQNQLTGIEIRAQIVGGAIDNLVLDQDAFIISEDELGNHNQIKGRVLTSYFVDNELDSVYVNGNGQTIMFVLNDSETETDAMNNVICSNIIFNFIDGEIENVQFLGQPTSKYIPFAQVDVYDTRLPGYDPRFSKKPNYIFMQMRKSRMEKIKEGKPRENEANANNSNKQILRNN
jgi:lipopolysaccharide export system protein LptA